MAPEKNDPLPLSSSDSASPSQFLERLLGAIAKALDGLVEGNQELKRAFELLRRSVEQSSKQVELTTKQAEKRDAELLKALTKFMDRVEQVAEQQKTVAGATSKAIEISRQSVDKAVTAFREETGKHKVHDPADDKEEISAQWVKIRWTTIIKYGPIALKVLGILGIAAASVYKTLKELAPLIAGWH